MAAGASMGTVFSSEASSSSTLGITMNARIKGMMVRYIHAPLRFRSCSRRRRSGNSMIMERMTAMKATRPIPAGAVPMKPSTQGPTISPKKVSLAQPVPQSPTVLMER